jgi:hypothetical protein
VDLIWNFTANTDLKNIYLTHAKWGLWQLNYANSSDCLLIGHQALITKQYLIDIYLDWFTSDNCITKKIASISAEGNSINRTNNSCLWSLTYLLPAKLEAFLLEKNDWKTINSLVLPTGYKQAFFHSLVIGLYVNFIIHKLISLYRNYYEQWCVAVVCLKTKHVCEISLKSDHFWADPFIIQEKNKKYIFFEELYFKKNRGELKVAELSETLNLINIQTILQCSYHLSYPNVFFYAGNYYLVPETAENNTIELYKAIEFPHQWQLMHYMMQGIKAYDPTLINYEDRWYLFVTIKQHQACSANDALYIFYADSPLSQAWQAHSQNPVLVDAASARPAGQFFWQAGKLYRPSQNCAGHYGKAININWVRKLSPSEYEEILIERHQAEIDENLLGMHTWNQLDDIRVIDKLYKKVRYV